MANSEGSYPVITALSFVVPIYIYILELIIILLSSLWLDLEQLLLIHMYIILVLFQLRNQAETELRALRAELTQKKMNMNLSRTQKMNSLGNSVSQSSGNLTARGPPPIASN